MIPYIVRSGDYLIKIAHALGFNADEAWNDPKNADLKAKREPNILHPGDILFVPGPAQTPLPIVAGVTNTYVATIPKTSLRLGFKNRDKPRANERYVVEGIGDPQEGTTDGDGMLVVEVPVHIREFDIVFPAQKVVYPVRVGGMDPISEPAGLRKRLQHLGYQRSPSDEAASSWDEMAGEERDRAAILSFQRDHGLAPTGEADEATKAAILNDHGS